MNIFDEDIWRDGESCVHLLKQKHQSKGANQRFCAPSKIFVLCSLHLYHTCHFFPSLSPFEHNLHMSWQGYVDNNLVGTGHVTQGAIVGLEGGVWAASSGFQVLCLF